MITNVTTGATGASAAEAAMKKSTGMNKDDFLKLFVTQLQNQDPLNPQDGTEFIGQLAQLTQVEQAYNTNTNLQNLLNQGNNSTSFAAVSLIGKEVQALGSQVDLQQGATAQLNLFLEGSASQVNLTIRDENGNVIKTLDAGALAAGKASVAWDGTDNSGAAVAPGAYTFSAAAVDVNGQKVAATPFIKGRVDGVDISGTNLILSLGNVKLNLTDVTSVAQGV